MILLLLLLFSLKYICKNQHVVFCVVPYLLPSVDVVVYSIVSFHLLLNQFITSVVERQRVFISRCRGSVSGTRPNVTARTRHVA